MEKQVKIICMMSFINILHRIVNVNERYYLNEEHRYAYIFGYIYNYNYYYV